jgi:CHRD domain
MAGVDRGGAEGEARRDGALTPLSRVPFAAFRSTAGRCGGSLANSLGKRELRRETMRTIISGRAVALTLTLLSTALWAASSMAATQSFQVQLSGAQQVPAVQTGGMGTADLTYDPTTRELTWSLSCSGLSGAVTMAHFHDAPAGKNGRPVIWLSKRGSPVANPITGHAQLTAAQAKQFLAGDWYINVHTMAHPAGEIRGQVTPPSS